MEKKGYLLLEDGTLYEGVLRGAQKDAAAELVFLTSVVGYMDTLTDPGYEGQIVVQTFPAIGNYGVIPLENASAPRLAGYVVRELCDEPSNFRCQGKLDDYLRDNGVTCLTDVDTRAISRRLRDNGVMKAAILCEKPEDIQAAIASLKVNAAKAFPKGCEEFIPAANEGKYSVALWDFGAKGSLQAELEARGCAVTCVPADATADMIAELQPDGVVITNGAGDPAECVNAVNELRELCHKRIPTMGIGLGHQLLALSQNGGTVKLPYGHRGGNQPVKDLRTGMNYITSQNHGYAVDNDNLPDNATLRFINCNDGTCEGLDYSDMPAFSVQFMPQISGGPLDTRFLFERFIALMGGNKECR
ncbi:MAG: carbamoyl phosphate synthase small subunit [Clostridiales bacterium]|nr:carbamoyl phosphate synthase small subunit [Clostridiales bacterium]